MIISQPDRVLLTQQIARHAPSLRGEILDIGGGSVRRYERLCSSCTTYRTMDINPSWNPDIVGSAEAIPLPNESVDSVISTQVLEHVPHPWIAIQEIHRVLRPGGHYLITIPQMNEMHEEPHDYFRYTRFGLESMLHDVGLTVTAMDQRGKYYSVVAQIKIRRMIDRWQPYSHPLAMAILGPWSAILTRIAIARDRRVHDIASEKHAIGWLVFGRKPTAS